MKGKYNSGYEIPHGWCIKKNFNNVNGKEFDFDFWKLDNDGKNVLKGYAVSVMDAVNKIKLMGYN